MVGLQLQESQKGAMYFKDNAPSLVQNLVLSAPPSTLPSNAVTANHSPASPFSTNGAFVHQFGFSIIAPTQGSEMFPADTVRVTFAERQVL